LYLSYLEAEVAMGQDSDTIVNDDAHRGLRHVAIIMDGNGRWATQRGRPRLFGHHAGAKRVREIVESCPDVGVKYLTIFAFSTENWKRTQVEVAGLMGLFRRYITKETRALVQFGVRVRFIGDREHLDAKLVSLMNRLEEKTAENTKTNLTIALNYGARDEVARATKLLAKDVARGLLDPDKVDEGSITKYLDTRVLPDPDLVIRTSGEARISNFLLWQSAYAEYEFVDTLWPDFSREEFTSLCASYGDRDRRFGGVKK
jgi:undecaprenyl diphosphate synthase